MKARASALFWVLFVVFFLVRIFLSFKSHLFFWDEAVYVAMGKFLWSFGAVGFWEILRPFFLPLLLGGFFWLGFHPVFLSEMFLLCFAVGYVLITCLLGRELFGKTAGWISGSLVLLTPLFFLSSGALLSDIPSGFFSLLALYLFVRRYFLFSGIVSCLALLMRFPHGLITISILFLFVLFRERTWITDIKKYFVGIGVPLVPFFIFNYFMYHGQTNFFFALVRPLLYAFPHQSNPFTDHGTVLYYILGIVRDNYLYLFLIVGVFAYFFSRLFKERNITSVFLSLFFYLAYFGSITNKQMRFSFAFLGLAAIVAAFGITWVWSHYRHLVVRVGVVVFVLLSVFFVVWHDADYFTWRYDVEPPIVSRYYSYFDSHPIDKAVLTADPVLAAYSDARFIPYYFSVSEGLKIVESSLSEGKAGFIVYSPRSFLCVEGDVSCARDLAKLDELVRNNRVVFNETFDGNEYWIYEVGK